MSVFAQKIAQKSHNSHKNEKKCRYNLKKGRYSHKNEKSAKLFSRI